MKKNNIKPLFDLKKSLSNRQDNNDIFIPNGAIYIFRLNKKFFQKGINFDKTIPYIMSETDTIDINDLSDLNKARKLFKSKIKI